MKNYMTSAFVTAGQLGKVCAAATMIGFAALFAATTPAFAADFFISPTGSDSNSGTESAPFKSIMKAQSSASSGDTVYIRGGVYDDFQIAATDSNYNYVHDITKSGITYAAYPGDERPVFDFQHVPTNLRVAAFRVADKVTGINFKGFDVIGVKVGNQKQSEAFRVIGEANFENVAAHDNEANGFYFTTRGTGIVLNCDAYNNIGPTDTSAGNTDGFGAHAGPVSFINSRAWNNSDDGFDSISSSASVTYDHSWSFNHRGNQNGIGDQNGFKVGGYSYRTSGFPDPMPVHTVRYSLAVNNGANGFYANHQPGKSADWINNTAYNNTTSNFNMLERVNQTDITNIPGYREVLHNNIAYVGNAIINDNHPPENVTNNSWTIDGGLHITAADFVSLDTTQLSAPRKADGSLPDVTFMRPKTTSPLYTYGLGYLADQNPQDTEAPVTEAELNGTNTGEWYTGAVNVRLTAADQGAVTETLYRLNEGAEWLTYDAPFNVSEEGRHLLQFRSADAAGNVEETREVAFGIDASAPAFLLRANGTVVSDVYSAKDNIPVLLAVEASDACSGLNNVSIQVNGSFYQPGETIDFAGKTGNHAVHVSVSDQAGHTAEGSFSLRITTDLPALRSLLERYAAQGEITGALLPQLRNDLDQAEHQLKKGKRSQAAHHLEKLLKTLKKPPASSAITERAAAVLKADASLLIREWSSRIKE